MLKGGVCLVGSTGDERETFAGTFFDCRALFKRLEACSRLEYSFLFLLCVCVLEMRRNWKKKGCAEEFSRLG